MPFWVKGLELRVLRFGFGVRIQDLGYVGVCTGCQNK